MRNLKLLLPLFVVLAAALLARVGTETQEEMEPIKSSSVCTSTYVIVRPVLVVEKKIREEKREEEEKSLKVSGISLKSLSVQERKEKFKEILLPLIERANEEVLKEREIVLKVKRGEKLSPEEEKMFEAIKKKYRSDDLKELLKRVDAVPAAIVLAQGAIESGWGTSRFFTEANNIFGVYTYGKEGLKAKGSAAKLRIYPDLYSSVKDFIYNLNVGWAYKDFRELRSKGADVYTLAESLGSYSEMGEEYVELVKKVIKNNSFDALSEPELASGR